MKYMIAVDGSPSSVIAFNKSMDLMKVGDKLILATVLSNTTSPNKIFDELITKCVNHQIQYETKVIPKADPREALCNAVEEEEVDCLILGTRGLGAIKRAFLGSVSEYVVQHATCDVVVAK